jgi:hypothetical protein
MRRAAKVDGNQAEIVEALRSLGYSVRSTALCDYRHRLIENLDRNFPLLRMVA